MNRSALRQMILESLNRVHFLSLPEIRARIGHRLEKRVTRHRQMASLFTLLWNEALLIKLGVPFVTTLNAELERLKAEGYVESTVLDLNLPRLARPNDMGWALSTKGYELLLRGEKVPPHETLSMSDL